MWFWAEVAKELVSLLSLVSMPRKIKVEGITRGRVTWLIHTSFVCVDLVWHLYFLLLSLLLPSLPTSCVHLYFCIYCNIPLFSSRSNTTVFEKRYTRRGILEEVHSLNHYRVYSSCTTIIFADTFFPPSSSSYVLQLITMLMMMKQVNKTAFTSLEYSCWVHIFGFVSSSCTDFLHIAFNSEWQSMTAVVSDVNVKNYSSLFTHRWLDCTVRQAVRKPVRLSSTTFIS